MADSGDSAGGGTSSRGGTSGSGAGRPSASEINSWSIGQLMRFLRQRGIDTSGCVEKAELAALAERAAAAPAQSSVGAPAAGAAPDGGNGTFAEALMGSMRGANTSSRLMAAVSLR